MNSLQPTPPRRFTPQAVLGLVIVAYGLLLTADNLNLIDAGHILQYWPVALVIVGAIKFAQSDAMPGRLVGGGLAGFGTMLLLDRHWDIDVELDRLWPIALVGLGGFIVYRAIWGAEPAKDVSAATSDQNMSEFAFWSGKVRRNASPAFRRGDLTAIMGGVEVDLRGASTGGSEAVIDVFVWWGGIDITVPPDWAVSNQIVPIMGGADDTSTGTQDSKNRLVVRGFCIMGGVDINTGRGDKKQW